MNHVRRKIGIVAHSAEGAALCFITACREGQRLLGAHMYPEIVVSAIPMGLSMGAWEAEDYDAVAELLRRGVATVAKAGADFFVCSDNTAHIALERVVHTLPIPGLHIADVVCREIKAAGWANAGLLGTRWTMTGPVYAAALEKHGIGRIVPNETRREQLNRAIFDELCLARFLPSTTDMFIDAIHELKADGADCAILGCTEIPLIITDENSPLPTLDSTRLLAKHAVRLALSDAPLPAGGWIETDEVTVSGSR
jgi:aspartate racemase